MRPGPRDAARGGLSGPADSRRLSGREVAELARILSALSTHRRVATVDVYGVQIKISTRQNGSRQQQQQNKQQQQPDSTAGREQGKPQDNARARRRKRRAEKRAEPPEGAEEPTTPTIPSKNGGVAQPPEVGGQPEDAYARRMEKSAASGRAAAAEEEAAAADAPSAGAPVQGQQHGLLTAQPMELQQQLRPPWRAATPPRRAKRDSPATPGTGGSAGGAAEPLPKRAETLL